MHKRMILGLAAALLASLTGSAAESTVTTRPLWMRDVQISPDGASIAFTYKGDIWVVPTQGGMARQLTATDYYETTPVWSPDGKSIAYACARHGNLDVFMIDVRGGRPQRLTSNSAAETPEAFSPDGKSIYFSAAIQAPATSAMFPSSRMTQLYKVAVCGGAPEQVLGTPAQLMSWTDKTGKSFVYQDVKGFEDQWRKHHTSSVTRDLWLYDGATGKHTNLTNRAGEDRNPVVAGDRLYFLSEREGDNCINIYTAPLADVSKAQRLTAFKGNPVRFLSRGADGTLCFGYDGEIYTMKDTDKAPRRVEVSLIDPDDPVAEKKKVSSGATSAAPSPDGKSIAFTYRGDVFVTSVEYTTTKQITHTPEAEYGLSWAPDGKTLYYTSERDGNAAIYSAVMERPDDDINFENATAIKESVVVAADSHERARPDISPDGKKMAFVYDRTKLAVMDLKSKKVKVLTDGTTTPERNGSIGFVWSPDSKWLATEIVTRKHEPYMDIAIINVETDEIINLTASGYTDGNPKWVLDGNAVAFVSERYGMRNHASWGSMDDVFICFLNQDAYDRYRLSPEDYALYKEVEKRQNKDAKSDKKKSDKKDAKSDDDSEEVKAIKVEKDGIIDRIVRVTPMSTAMTDYAVTADGDNLYYISRAQDGMQLWKLDLRKGDHRMVSKISGGLYFTSDKDGKTLFVLGSSMRKLDPKSDKLTSISYSATMPLDHAAERTAMFDNMVREVGQRFYVADMHGVDWKNLTAHYRRFLPYINNNYDYAEMLSELLGELNVSHTGGRYSGSSASGDRTASLGLLYDMSYTGKGLRVAEVLKNGPFDRAASMLTPGMIIEKINGEEITPTADASVLLTDISGKKTLVSIYDPNSGQRWDEVVLPISASAHNGLMYNRWVRQRAADVDRWSNGRLGYVHIESMDDGSFRTVYSDVLGKYNNREGIVIDVRWNGGGRLHEDVEVFFSGKKYLTQEIRGIETCDMPSRRWNKPSIMLMCEACYSNAHGTPWVYKHQGIGKLVGMPVPGTMTSVNWVTMQDPSLVYGIPVIGYRTAEGTFLENSQLEPDVRVANDPAVIVTGEDQQLHRAVEELLHQMDASKTKK